MSLAVAYSFVFVAYSFACVDVSVCEHACVIFCFIFFCREQKAFEVSSSAFEFCGLGTMRTRGVHAFRAYFHCLLCTCFACKRSVHPSVFARLCLLRSLLRSRKCVCRSVRVCVWLYMRVSPGVFLVHPFAPLLMIYFRSFGRNGRCAKRCRCWRNRGRQG